MSRPVGLFGQVLRHREGRSARPGPARDWSRAHPCHLPLFVLIEPKDEVGALVDPLVIDAEVRSVFPPAQLLTPGDVQWLRPTLRQAVEEVGWRLDHMQGLQFLRHGRFGEASDLYAEVEGPIGRKG